MRFSAFLVISILFSSLSVQSQGEINQYDEQGRRHGTWKKYFRDSDQLRYEGQFDHGKEKGTFKFYCEECKDQPMVVKEFSSSDNTATTRYYTIKGKLVSEGMMDGKQRVGDWLFYHEKSDIVMSREAYKDGELHGKKITYYPNGNITEEVNYEEGVLQGDSKYFAPDGTLLKDLNYLNGELHGEAVYYDAYGNVTIRGFYKNGAKNGLWRYYQNGNLVLEETFPKPVERGN